MTAKDYLRKEGIHPSELIYWYGDDDVITLEQLLESYHQAKLKLLGIANVVGQSEQLKAFVVEVSKGFDDSDKHKVVKKANDILKSL